MKIILHWFVATVGVLLTSYLLSGVHVDTFITALLVAVVLGIINAFIKPVLIILTLPINLLSLGLFTLVINAVLVMLVTYIVPGFTVASFWWAIAFSVVLTLIDWALHKLVV